MTDFFDNYFGDFVKEHTFLTILIAALIVGAVILIIGTLCLGWDVGKMVHDLGQFISNLLYKPFDRSFDGLKDYVKQWSS